MIVWLGNWYIAGKDMKALTEWANGIITTEECVARINKNNSKVGMMMKPSELEEIAKGLGYERNRNQNNVDRLAIL